MNCFIVPFHSARVAPAFQSPKQVSQAKEMIQKWKEELDARLGVKKPPEAQPKQQQDEPASTAAPGTPPHPHPPKAAPGPAQSGLQASDTFQSAAPLRTPHRYPQPAVRREDLRVPGAVRRPPPPQAQPSQNSQQVHDR